jgi:hypothetical protein
MTIAFNAPEILSPPTILMPDFAARERFEDMSPARRMSTLKQGRQGLTL